MAPRQGTQTQGQPPEPQLGMLVSPRFTSAEGAVDGGHLTEQHGQRGELILPERETKDTQDTDTPKARGLASPAGLLMPESLTDGTTCR